LGIRADFTVVAPPHFPSEWVERADQGAQESCFSLAVVANDRRSLLVLDLDNDPLRDAMVRITNR
jgi:hypothetical protein